VSKSYIILTRYDSAWAFGLFIFTCHLCFIPYLVTSFKDVTHRCGQCGDRLATWHRSGKVDVHAHAMANIAPVPNGGTNIPHQSTAGVGPVADGPFNPGPGMPMKS
jgi:hypothetical protein